MIVPGAYIVTNNYNTKAAHREEINSDLGNWTLNGKHRVKLVGISTHQTRLKGNSKTTQKGTRTDQEDGQTRRTGAATHRQRARRWQGEAPA